MTLVEDHDLICFESNDMESAAVADAVTAATAAGGGGGGAVAADIVTTTAASDDDPFGFFEEQGPSSQLNHDHELRLIEAHKPQPQSQSQLQP